MIDIVFSTDLFASLEQTSGSGTKASEIGVLSYGVSMTDLEEVFLKLEDEEEDEDSEQPTGKGTDNDGDFVNLTNSMHVNGATVTSQGTDGVNLSELGKATVGGSQLVKNRILTLLKLRIRLIYRIKIRIVLQVIMPIIFICIGAGILTTQSDYARVEPVELDISSLKPVYLPQGSNPPLDYVGGEEAKPLLLTWFNFNPSLDK